MWWGCLLPRDKELMRAKEACHLLGPSGASHGEEDARLLVDRPNGNSEGFTVGKQWVGITTPDSPHREPASLTPVHSPVEDLLTMNDVCLPGKALPSSIFYLKVLICCCLQTPPPCSS